MLRTSRETREGDGQDIYECLWRSLLPPGVEMVKPGVRYGRKLLSGLESIPETLFEL